MQLLFRGEMLKPDTVPYTIYLMYFIFEHSERTKSLEYTFLFRVLLVNEFDSLFSAVRFFGLL